MKSLKIEEKQYIGNITKENNSVSKSQPPQL